MKVSINLEIGNEIEQDKIYRRNQNVTDKLLLYGEKSTNARNIYLPGGQAKYNE
jgi:hypothetical protein